MRPPTSPRASPPLLSGDTRSPAWNSGGRADRSVATTDLHVRLVDEIGAALAVTDQSAEQRIALVTTRLHPVAVRSVGDQFEPSQTIGQTDRDLVVLLA